MKRGGFLRRSPLRRVSKKREQDPALAKQRPHKGLKPIPLSIRRAVYERDGSRCRVCHRFLESGQRVVHHRKKRSLGGTNDLVNLLTLCGPHHTLIHAGHMQATSRELGYLVAEWDDPALIDVVNWPVVNA